jgi:methylenetetrahydrofolate reductase (NADPH)
MQPFRIDDKLVDILKNQSFTLSAEIIPPRNGAQQAQILEQISELVSAGVKFLSVTKGAGGSLRGGSLPIAQVIKDHFSRPAIAHFTCRDLTPEDVENQLMDHHYFGIRNILALRGDPPQGITNWIPNEKSYPYAYQLIKQIAELNNGKFLSRDSTQEISTSKDRTDFCIGAAAYPDEKDPTARVEHFRLKVDAGAQYGITQMLYDVESYSRFQNELEKYKIKIPILPGLRILKSQTQALKMQQRFQMNLPSKFIQSLPKDENEDTAIEVFTRLVEDFRKAGAPGVHVFVLSDTGLSCKAIRNLV